MKSENVKFKRSLKVLIPVVIGIFLISAIIKYFSSGMSNTIGGSAKLAQVIRLNDIEYWGSNDVIPDDRIIGEEIGKVKRSITSESGNTTIGEGTATMLPVGTPIYSLKDMDERKAVAAKYNGDWVAYRAREQNAEPMSIYQDDYPNAKRIVVTYDLGKGKVNLEITDRDTIKKIAEYLKNLQPMKEYPGISNAKRATFYFYSEDKDGIGKVAQNIIILFNDPLLGGYIPYNGGYKISQEIMKLFVPVAIENGYNETLGGTNQIYEALLSPKILIRRYMKDTNAAAPEVKVINKGEKLLEEGLTVEDNLSGNFKLMITMKNTTIQEGVKQQFIADYKKIPGAVSLKVTSGENKQTTIIYIGFDTKPDYIFQESGETIMILMKNN